MAKNRFRTSGTTIATGWIDITCDGKKEPPKAFITAIYVRQGGKWRWTNYQETVLK
jgi:hypothetical protein